MEENDNVFAALKARRFEEEKCLEFLCQNRHVLHNQCGVEVDSFFNERHGHYLYKRAQRPSQDEIALKAKFKKAYNNKELFTDNRIERNEEYVHQRKRDFAVSQERVKKFVAKLQEEYEKSVSEKIERCKNWGIKTEDDSRQLIDVATKDATSLIIDSAVALSVISNSLSFIPTFYSSIMKYFHNNSITFDKESEKIPDFEYENYFKPLRPETQRLFITMAEACVPESMTPPLVERRGRAVCVVSKPLVFTEEQCSKIASKLGWKAVFASQFQNVVTEIFTLLSETEDDVLIFGFPNTPKELKDIYDLFNPVKPSDDSCAFLPRPTPSSIDPFDMIIELDISDEIVLRDVLAVLEDPETGEKFDIRELSLDTENQLVRLEKANDPYYDIIQFPSRSVTLKANFDLIKNDNSEIYNIVPLESREVTDELIDNIAALVNDIPAPDPPKYSPDVTYPTIIQTLHGVSDELREFFMSQWRSIETTYYEAIHRSFELLNSVHLLLISHLEKARSEMQEFLRRPGSSQHLLVEFQEWHCNQVERCMRRMQKVKDECAIRINALRENLVAIENDRKTEEESKQKELLNAPFRTTLFELVNNACTTLAQAELDRWVATRSLMLDLNQVVSDADLVPPLPRKKLNLVVDPSRDKTRKGAKKPQRNTPTSRNRADSKLQPFESPLFEQLEGVKKYVSDAAVIYMRSTTPISTRGKARPGKDKNPFAPHKIAALDEFIAAFTDDDVYLVTRMDQIADFTHDEVNVVQQSFDAYLDDSTNWIQSNYERRKSISDTAIAYMLKKVNDEEQINHLILLNESQCTIDMTQLIVGTEESPKIPPAFPEQLVADSPSATAEDLMNGIVDFIVQTNNVQ
ncbi:hypothetical protein TRFO_10411 [Tritrichomonas foetus]|uniref:CPC1/SPEF2 domain-containing protein n=1 Tax=Tritrichomonas foetus TaxID=1144522 RepID=A0A1J4JBC2_9EUKA|nr:hypothetical protein TRFO_10411 [Tritrichomonas foetus]|eukprot:OHS95535.1 hypothetical protein TRFO_10411 [Tritrichomonas foetus]